MSELAHDQQERDDNGQWQQDQSEEWYCRNRRIINEINGIVENEIKNSAHCRSRAAGSCTQTSTGAQT